MNQLIIRQFRGKEALPYRDQLAALRIEIFREYPYLYDGSYDYEKKYLETYFSTKESLVILVFDDKNIVGASTAVPLIYESEDFIKPFQYSQFDINDIFYFGESLLKTAYRGKKVYRAFFEKREHAAREYGSRIVTFCAVDRALNDHRKPKDYLPLDAVWQHFGYKKSNLKTRLAWKEITEEKMSPKTLSFWLKYL